jgi:hypothetical protein
MNWTRFFLSLVLFFAGYPFEQYRDQAKSSHGIKQNSCGKGRWARLIHQDFVITSFIDSLVFLTKMDCLSLVLDRNGSYRNVDKSLVYIIEHDTQPPREERINLFVESVLA